jgi:hypothetical protein
MVPNMKIKASITIHESFSNLLDELGEPEAREDIDAVLKETRTRRYYAFFTLAYSRSHRIANARYNNIFSARLI